MDLKVRCFRHRAHENLKNGRLGKREDEKAPCKKPSGLGSVPEMYDGCSLAGANM